MPSVDDSELDASGLKDHLACLGQASVTRLWILGSVSRNSMILLFLSFGVFSFLELDGTVELLQAGQWDHAGGGPREGEVRREDYIEDIAEQRDFGEMFESGAGHS